ncbi:lipid II flippase Amj family protein [Desulfosporosinus sp. PR]|uniref:lipid II flippase Amj family protein n=1 Tax=Candidatus Desulfosporosinus nitrosoreducens TaxID=3401928 RepID=UPI0027F73BA1|nr:lipid II flippase Amj family protein [Desulfosporosinus sp. PR]MDQ7094896.1 lipid II flippase Amj family protein [Desulfosporosinus sp. PR]
MQFNVSQLFVSTFIIHIIDTFAYSVRLNSVKSRQFALSNTFFNLFYLVSLAAHTLQAPLIGGLMDISLNQRSDPLPAMRKVIWIATLGVFVGILLTPSFLRFFSKAVKSLERSGSVPSVVMHTLRPGNVRKFFWNVTLPSKSMVNTLPFRKVPGELMALNAFVTGLYTVGVMSAFYATLLVNAQHRLAASASAGIINSAANIILMLFVDPKSSIITDQALKGNRPYEDVKALVVMLIGSKLAGTLMGQVLLIPVAHVIAIIYK